MIDFLSKLGLAIAGDDASFGIVLLFNGLAGILR